jgi:hypothetical protein
VLFFIIFDHLCVAIPTQIAPQPVYWAILCHGHGLCSSGDGVSREDFFISPFFGEAILDGTVLIYERCVLCIYLLDTMLLLLKSAIDVGNAGVEYIAVNQSYRKPSRNPI